MRLSTTELAVLTILHKKKPAINHLNEIHDYSFKIQFYITFYRVVARHHTFTKAYISYF